MEELYKKVTQGIFNKIPSQFSNDLYKIVQLLLQVNPEKRPSCSEILKNPIIQRRIEFFKNYAGDDCSEDQALLKTILVPNNLGVLSDKLPKPNYGHKSVNNKKPNYNLNENIPYFNNESKVTVEEIKKNEIITNLNVLKKNGSKKDNISILNRPIISNNSNKSVDKLENAKNLLLKNIITKSVSKRELPALKKNILIEDKRNKNQIPNNYNSENIIRKKNDNIFDILNKKNLIRVNHLNRLQRQNINKLIINSSKNNAIINMNPEISNNHGTNSIDLYRKKGNYKVPGRLVPIKKNLLNIA
jgi:NIMA (never in mitosis gene a)-related kinase